MRRWLRITLAYDGSRYHGWQVQAQAPTIQQQLEKALQKVTGQRIRAVASGRTDAGVHALGQEVSCETDCALSAQVLARALNAWLPADIRVLRVIDAPASFNAIDQARSKTYRYWIQDGGIPDVFLRNFCWYLPQKLDDEAMRQAARTLLGSHDFAAFQSAGSSRISTVRTIYRLDVDRRDAGRGVRLVIEVEADGFLYRMARNLVGTLVRVGQGREPVSWPAEVLAGRDRRRAGMTAPAHGLFLVNVNFDT